MIINRSRHQEDRRITFTVDDAVAGVADVEGISGKGVEELCECACIKLCFGSGISLEEGGILIVVPGKFAAGGDVESVNATGSALKFCRCTAQSSTDTSAPVGAVEEEGPAVKLHVVTLQFFQERKVGPVMLFMLFNK